MPKQTPKKNQGEKRLYDTRVLGIKNFIGTGKVYAVTEGIYSAYRVTGIFSTKELAQKYMDSYITREEARIEEYILNPHGQELNAGYNFFMVRMDRSGNVIEVEKSELYPEQDINNGAFIFDINENLVWRCFAKDKEHVVKITNEKRIYLIANNKFPGV